MAIRSCVLSTTLAVLLASAAEASQRSADCMYRKPNGNIVLHHCAKPQPKAGSQLLPKRPPSIDFHPRRILVVPVGPSWDI